jgi:hypothetical protein
MAETLRNYEFSIEHVPRELSEEELWQRSLGFTSEPETVQVAVDGAVRYSFSAINGTVHSANHHDDQLPRLQTPASCRQTADILATRNYQFAARGLGRVAGVCVDYDPDVAEAFRLIQLDADGVLAQADSAYRNRSRELTRLEDLMDRTSGHIALTLPKEVVEMNAYVYEPAMAVRKNGATHQSIVQAQLNVNERAHQYASGNPSRLVLDTQFEALSENGSCVVIEELGQFAVLGAMTQGWRNIVSIRRYDPRTGLPHVALHSVDGRLSPQLWDLLNKCERTEQPYEKWGGCELTGGSPRGIGTALNLHVVASLIDKA